MSRVQLALNVDDLDTAITFYSKLFDTEPAKVRPGYANFAIAEPPLKLVLIEGEGAGGTLNHLGVEVESTAEVSAAQRRLSGCGLETTTEDEVTCVGEDGYDDVGPGMPIEVYDQDGDLLGETALASGFVLETGRCSFHVVIQNVPEAEVYVVSSPDRGELRFTRGDMAASDWIVTMSLGN